MPLKIKIFLTFLIILIAIATMMFELFIGNPSLIYILVFVSFLMTIGIWIFPEVVTKKDSNKKYKKNK